MTAAAPPLRVVIADDAREIRFLLRLALDDERFVVVGEAEDGAQAVEIVRAEQPDAVVLDLAMPVLDGMQAIPEIRRDSPQTRIVVLSGFDAAHMASEAIAIGADAYVEKGAAFEDIAGMLALVAAGTADAPTTVTARITEPPAVRESLDELISVFIHELQTPLAVVQGFATTLRTSVEQLDAATIVSGAEAIERNAKHLADLLRTFADARALEVGRLALQLERVPISEVVRETVQDLRPVIDPHPVALDLDDAVVVDADRVRLRQVITNLLSNAAKFSPPAGSIEVSVERAGDDVLLTVRDHGPGIADSQRALLFERFSRLGRTEKGTGLGLYISRGIARAHGGDLTLGRVGDEGTAFVLSLRSAA